MPKLGIHFALAIVLALFVAACAPQRPVLYPNEKFKQAGPAVAEGDVQTCVRLAEGYGVDDGRADGPDAEDVALSTGAGAAGGAARGAVYGHAGKGAAAGAAGAASRGVFRGLFGRRGPDTAHRRFVERCLRERGYETVGWK